MMELIKYLGEKGDRWAAFLFTGIAFFVGVSILTYWVGESVSKIIRAFRGKN